MDLSRYIRTVNDFPKTGVVYRDITPLFLNPKVVKYCIEEVIRNLPSQKIDKVMGIEARGFFLGPLLAERLNAGFIPVRKSGKLPYKTVQESYDLEYGTDRLEIHQDALQKGENVLIHDDVLATGGTAQATCRLVEQLGGNLVQCNFIIEIAALKGRNKLGDYPVNALLNYNSGG